MTARRRTPSTPRSPAWLRTARWPSPGPVEVAFLDLASTGRDTTVGYRSNPRRNPACQLPNLSRTCGGSSGGEDQRQARGVGSRRRFVWSVTRALDRRSPAPSPSTRSEPSILAIGSVDGADHDVRPRRRADGRTPGVRARSARPVSSHSRPMDGRCSTVNDDGMIALWHDSAGPSLLSTPIDPA